jgi:biofilm PGA synthesis N-glycosyltransferase PgaC
MSAVQHPQPQQCTEQHEGLGLYWRYEKAVRRAETRFGSTIVYTGAISAVRRTLFSPLPEETLVDDLVTPLRVLSRGYRVVFEPEARAVDWISHEPGHEFARKVRTLAGLAQTVAHCRQFVGPLQPHTWWQFISHKVLRLVAPYALLCAFVTSAMLQGPLYRAAFLLQALVYGLGAVGLVYHGQGVWRRLLAAPGAFVMLNLAAVAGVVRYATGQRSLLWRPVHPAQPSRT